MTKDEFLKKLETYKYLDQSLKLSVVPLSAVYDLLIGIEFTSEESSQKEVNLLAAKLEELEQTLNRLKKF